MNLKLETTQLLRANRSSFLSLLNSLIQPYVLSDIEEIDSTLDFIACKTIAEMIQEADRMAAIEGHPLRDKYPHATNLHFFAFVLGTEINSGAQDYTPELELPFLETFMDILVSTYPFLKPFRHVYIIIPSLN